MFGTAVPRYFQLSPLSVDRSLPIDCPGSFRIPGDNIAWVHGLRKGDTP